MPARRCLAVAALALLSGLAPEAAEEGFVPLVLGDDPRQFELVGIGPESIRIDSGEVRLSGVPHGYFATRASYQDYVVAFDWRYERPEGLGSDAEFRGNSGLLVHIQGPHKVWPRSIEVQLSNADAGHIFAIFGATFRGEKDAEAQARAIRPVGQWNHTEVTCRGGTIACTLNGLEVGRGTAASPDRGPLGWQSEGQPIRFRNLRIKVGSRQ